MPHLVWQVLRMVRVDTRHVIDGCKLCSSHLGLVLYRIHMIILELQCIESIMIYRLQPYDSLCFHMFD